MKLRVIHAPRGWKSNDCFMTCQRCKRRIRYSEHMKTWDGLIVCKEDWDPKHNSLYPTPVYKDEMKPFPDATGAPVDVYIPNGSVDGADLDGN